MSLQAETYELLALGMRYWFALLGVVIVLRAARWTWYDHRAHMKTMASLPDAGLMGEVVNVDNGKAWPLPREGVIGSGKTCDLRLPGLRKRELEFLLKEGTGVHLIPCHVRHPILLDGTPLGTGGYALHGSRISIPGHFLRLRLFAGLDVPQRTDAHDADAGRAPSGDAFDMATLGQYDAFREMEQSETLPVIPAEPSASPWPEDTLAEYAQDEPQAVAQHTWMYAIPPAADVTVDDEIRETLEQTIDPPAQGRKRRGQRHED